jgi:hypothetical protein
MIDDDATIDVEQQCPLCGERTNVYGVSVEALMRWKSGELIQNCFPNMSVDDREIIMTGIGKCWG